MLSMVALFSSRSRSRINSFTLDVMKGADFLEILLHCKGA